MTCERNSTLYPLLLSKTAYSQFSAPPYIWAHNLDSIESQFHSRSKYSIIEIREVNGEYLV